MCAQQFGLDTKSKLGGYAEFDKKKRQEQTEVLGRVPGVRVPTEPDERRQWSGAGRGRARLVASIQGLTQLLLTGFTVSQRRLG